MWIKCYYRCCYKSKIRYIWSQASVDYWRTIKLVVTNLQVQAHERLERKDRISLFRFWTHSQMHSLKRVVPSGDDEIRSCGSTVSNRYKLIHTRVSSTRFFVVHFVAKWYILQQKCLKGQIGTCLLGTRGCNFYPCTPTLRVRMHSVTDRWTDRQMDDRMMPIADHTV